METELITEEIQIETTGAPPITQMEVVTEITYSTVPAVTLENNEIAEECLQDEVETEELLMQPYIVPYDLSKQPALITGATQEFKTSFSKGCKWSPDGSCIMTNSDDNVIRLFNLPQELYNVDEYQNAPLPEMSSVLQVQTKELVYDYAWYPLMSSADPATCCFATTARDNPIHLWDAYTGELRCSYRAYNQVDEVTAAYSVAFDPSGTKLYCGFDRSIRIFYVNQPGRDCETRYTKSSKGELISQVGIISCIAVNPAMPSLYAAGSYLRSIGLYAEPDGTPLCLLNGQAGGITHLCFSPDGTKLFSGGRKDSEILGWDLRNPGQILHVLQRSVDTNQRVYFDLDNQGRYLFSGNSNEKVSVWDLQSNTNPSTDSSTNLSSVLEFEAHQDCVNGISLHPSLPIIATSSGQRHFPSVDDDDDSSVLLNFESIREENSLKLWSLK
nr:EOG090X06W9 [Lepidurus arcticus]